jgi:hypothetical protein
MRDSMRFTVKTCPACDTDAEKPHRRRGACSAAVRVDGEVTNVDNLFLPSGRHLRLFSANAGHFHLTTLHGLLFFEETIRQFTFTLIQFESAPTILNRQLTRRGCLSHSQSHSQSCIASTGLPPRTQFMPPLNFRLSTWPLSPIARVGPIALLLGNESTTYLRYCSSAMLMSSFGGFFS